MTSTLWQQTFIIFLFLFLICFVSRRNPEGIDENEYEEDVENSTKPANQLFPLPLGQCPPLYPSPYSEFPEPGSCGRVTAGTRCHMGCLQGFELLGSCSRLCLETGDWSGSESLCINQNIQCQPLPIRLESFIEYLNETDNATILESFEITTISYLDSEKESNESNSRQLQQPQGVPARAVDPLGCLNFAGGICRFYCPPGTYPQGNLILICQVNRQWSGQVPYCSLTQIPTQFPTNFPT
jgi:hypothetical protein